MNVHTRASIALAIRDKTGITKEESEEAVVTMCSYVSSIPLGDKLELRGFGTYSRKLVASNGKHNPATGAPVESKSYTTIGFKASKALRRYEE